MTQQRPQNSTQGGQRTPSKNSTRSGQRTPQGQRKHYTQRNKQAPVASRPPARLPQTRNHILLVGFMGCGKTSVSRQLRRMVGLPLLDVDTYIEQMQGRSVKQIFAAEGEAGFRRIETEALAGLAYAERSVVSCGGGVVGSAVNRAIVKELGTVVYLQVPLEEAVGRISDPSTRPLLSGARPVADIYAERLPWYEEVATFTVNTAGHSVKQNARQVLLALEERGLL